MKIFRALVVVVPVVVVLAMPQTARAGCPANGYFPMNPGHWFTYQTPAIGNQPPQQWKITISNPVATNPSVIQFTSTNVTTPPPNPLPPPAIGVVTCVPGGLQFDFAKATATGGLASMTIT